MQQLVRALSVVAVLVGCSSGAVGQGDARTEAAPQASRPTSTVAAATTTTEAPTTTLPPATTTTVASTTTVAITAPPPPYDPLAFQLPANGSAVLAQPNSWLGVDRHYLDGTGEDPASDCSGLTAAVDDRLIASALCGSISAATIRFAYTATTYRADEGWHVFIWQEMSPNAWEPVLKYVTEPGLITDVRMEAVNLDGIGSDELVVTFTYAGTHQVIDVDVLSFDTDAALVVAHLGGLPFGVSAVGADGLTLWAKVYDPATAACCTEQWQQAFLRPTWTIEYGEIADAPPPSED